MTLNEENGKNPGKEFAKEDDLCQGFLVVEAVAGGIDDFLRYVFFFFKLLIQTFCVWGLLPTNWVRSFFR